MLPGFTGKYINFGMCAARTRQKVWGNNPKAFQMKVN
jgi:hypothetical protein